MKLSRSPANALAALLVGSSLVSGLHLTETTARSINNLMLDTARRHALFGLPAAVGVGILASPNSANAGAELTSYQDGPKGLKYIIINEGTGDKPQRGQKVKTSYALYGNGFPDDSSSSKLIDSSKGLFGEKPFEFNVGVSQVVKGWDLALMDMRAGESRRLVVPAALGYGDRGAGGDIKPGATLYFEVTLAELGSMPTWNDKQLQWLEEHPLD